MSDKCALVTGSVSGIGRALAKELASRGYDLIICSAGERLDAASDGLRQTGVQVSAAKADLVTRIVTGYRGVIRGGLNGSTQHSTQTHIH